MKLSISNIGWEAGDDEKVYELMKKYDFSGLEIAPTRIFPENPYDDLTKAGEWAANLKKEYGFEIPSMQSIWFGRNENIFNSEEENKALALYTQKAVLFAKECGISNLVFGCPRNRNVPDKANKEDADSFFKSIGDYAFAHGTVIGMEANPPIYNTNYINDTGAALDLIEKVDSFGFKLNLDVGTMIFNGERPDILKNKVDMINHVHISEPYLKLIEKRNLHGELSRLLKDEGYNGFVSIEMGKGNELSVIEGVMEYVKELFGC